DYFPGAVGAAGGDGKNADGANQGFVPGHDQPLLTMPDCGQHTISPADRSLTLACTLAEPDGKGPRDQAKRGNLPVEGPRARRSSPLSRSRPGPFRAAVTASQARGDR